MTRPNKGPERGWRKRRIKTLVLEGLSNLAIAADMCVTEKTIKWHLTEIYRAEQVRSRHELIAKYGTGVSA